MIPSRTSAALNPLGLDFDRFLYAQVGDDQHGGLLSVISALARVGVDPWEEAASLARLPLDTAAQALSALLARLPAGTGKPADPLPVAARLVTLLPHGAPLTNPLLRSTNISSAVTGTDYRFLAVAWALCIVLILVGQLVMRHRAASAIAPQTTPALPANGTGPGAAQPDSR